MGTARPTGGKKYFTANQANAMLPLVRQIVGDITQLARTLREHQEPLERLNAENALGIDEAHAEELRHLEAEFERGRQQLADYVQELRELGVELKDFFTGLIDFPCKMDGREVYLCWRLGEKDVAHWHEIDAGFAGRQPLEAMTHLHS